MKEHLVFSFIKHLLLLLIRKRIIFYCLFLAFLSIFYIYGGFQILNFLPWSDTNAKFHEEFKKRSRILSEFCSSSQNEQQTNVNTFVFFFFFLKLSWGWVPIWYPVVVGGG